MPKYFNWGAAKVNGFVIFIPNSTCSWLIYKKGINFCINIICYNPVIIANQFVIFVNSFEFST